MIQLCGLLVWAALIPADPGKPATDPVGNYALALWPSLDGKGMAVELRRVDMSTVLVRDVMSQLPKGDTYYKAPAAFETTTDIAPRLGVQLGEGEKTVSLQLRYGNRRLTLTLER